MEEKNINQSVLENEEELVERARVNDEAFGVLYEFYFKKIYGYTAKRVGHCQTTEDLVSQTFMKAFTKLDTYKKGTGSFKAWLYRIATNTIIDHYRKKGRRIEVDIEEIHHLESGELAPELLTDRSIENVKIREVLSRLKEKEQEIIQLKFFGELSNDEIANVLQISGNNAGVKVHRALTRFKEEYSKYV
ncbi:hypothetical protein COY25_03150 [Candidatus Uhrbacteria bacterium CG_4_10_14_0_2_um_filter_41_7]|uniref:RNA polymerase subunit sigma-24 n=1 Tax=Candidatus Uhrbacteria bacterium CG_4_9_14_3_um_filter_41_35 TaxID=1975034 RepID=A0A2M7XG45_9BACT|nr:MAG: hypothetical protein COV92_00855 [Candidatus Uhrbacteria bacterium CG11_big_fil_rev_8_21_14_0_20_41_9]PIZ53692.1 MAG: hypothetical protein COY25_03150 [Candidatus Uhrbacteria bacterium CG_4_10_14_0_2_um_filter_41_7]PJA46706.1 MAG: hypothetical protein CO173_02985 [Candidatus Uhrbacteria bacterium CG_4_9_14_3_um_filter_41_35]